MKPNLFEKVFSPVTSSSMSISTAWATGSRSTQQRRRAEPKDQSRREFLLAVLSRMPNGVVNVLFQALQCYQRIDSADEFPLRAMNFLLSFCEEADLSMALPYTVPLTFLNLIPAPGMYQSCELEWGFIDRTYRIWF